MILRDNASTETTADGKQIIMKYVFFAVACSHTFCRVSPPHMCSRLCALFPIFLFPPRNGKRMVREGCMLIPEEYLHAAVDAGCGAKDGMYSHLGAMKRLHGGAHNIGSKPVNSRAGRQSKGARKGGSKVVSKGGNVHGFSGTNSSHQNGGRGRDPPKRKNNIKRCVQGRSSSMNRSKAGTAHSSSYAKGKGVVSGLGGCQNQRVKNRRDAQKTAAGCRKGRGGAQIAQLASGSGGRTFIKKAGTSSMSAGGRSAAGAGIANARASRSTGTQSTGGGRKAVTRKLGGGGAGKKSAGGSARLKAGGTQTMSDQERMRAARLARFAK